MSRIFTHLADFFDECFQFCEFAPSTNANDSNLAPAACDLSECFEFCFKNFDMSRTMCLSRAGFDASFEDLRHIIGPKEVAERSS